MRKEQLLKEVQRNKLLENSGVNSVSGVDLISIDIQPTYEQAFDFNLNSFIEFINNNYDSMNSLTFLFNGLDLGFPDENEYKYWLFENGLEENIIELANFYDKGYAFFRFCMDEGIDDDKIVDLIKYMVRHNINNSREIDENMWNEFMNEYGHSDVRELLELADDMINIPDLMEYLQRFRGRIVLCGGGINECLKEVEIALMALDKDYNILTKYTY
jgi:hypothetical protein